MLYFEDHMLFNYISSFLDVYSFHEFNYSIDKVSDSFNEVLTFITSSFYQFDIYSYGSGKICRFLLYKDDKLLLKKDKLSLSQLRSILSDIDSFLGLA